VAEVGGFSGVETSDLFSHYSLGHKVPRRKQLVLALERRSSIGFEGAGRAAEV